MSWPRPLRPPDPAARAAATALGRHLARPEAAFEAAARWARLLELSIGIRPVGLPRGARSVAAVGFRTAQEGAGHLQIDSHLLSLAVARLSGAPAEPAAPLPLSPAEEGLLAWLALAWLGGLPDAPALEWVHGGDPTWACPRPGHAAVAWRIELAGTPGFAVWHLPDAPPVGRGPVDAVPVPLWIRGGSVRVAVAPRSGDLLPLPGGLRLEHARGPLGPVRVAHGRLTLAPRSETPMHDATIETLPVPLTVELGQLTLTAGEVGALAPGHVLPFDPGDPPVVTLRAGDRTVAVGILVDDNGVLAIQLTRVALDG